MKYSLILTVIMSASVTTSWAAVELDKLWDFSQPQLSEARFREALATAKGDDALILQTQIARSLGLRRQFEAARSLLREIEPGLSKAGPEARVRHALELGRTHASAKHTPEELSAEHRQAARDAYQKALAIAREHKLDNLAIDAIHMFAFIDTAPADQLKWGLEALALAQRSAQPAAQRWEASIQNNIGYALHQLGRYDEALTHLRAAIPLREAQGQAAALREAWWMVAWTLRALHRQDEALAIQQRLEREHEAAGTRDAYVFEELEILHRARGETALADSYARKLADARPPTSSSKP